MKILSIETSCDETALALVDAKGDKDKPKFKVLKNLVTSQINIHRPFGGVVPNLAKREHLKNLPILLERIGTEKELQKLDAVAVTVGPGLEPALWTGIEFAKTLSKRLNKPLIGANHLEGHLYSFLLDHKGKLEFPALGLVVSGGHTILLLMKSLTEWKKLGETRDDAVGEAFDKVARLLDLPYPGGPEVEKLAKEGDPNSIPFPRPMIYTKDYDFSYSGLKTAVLYYLRDKLSTNNKSVTNKRISKFEKNSLFADVAASFQQAAFEVLVSKAMRAANEFGAKSVILAGGVAASKTLKEMLEGACNKNKLKLLVPGFEFNTDNAAMIAAGAYISILKKGKKYSPRWSSGEAGRIAANGTLNM